MKRAYSILNIKTINEDERIIEGIASTPTPDRVDDIVEPMGAKFSLPMPLLWQHNRDEPIGQVVWAKQTPDGIPFRAQIANINEPGKLKDLLDFAWQSIKTKLVRAVSIGFRSLEAEPINPKDPWGGQRFKAWEWLELSAVTIPAQAEATINVIRSIDTDLRERAETAATGQERKPAGATAVKIKPKERHMAKPKSLADQISDMEATRAAKVARMSELMKEAGGENQTLGAAEQDEFDGLDAEVEALDRDLVRLRKLEKLNKESAKPVDDKTVTHETAPQRVPVQIKQAPVQLEKGAVFSRYAMALMMGKGSRSEALSIAKSNERWVKESPQLIDILKTAVDAGTTTDATWAGNLVFYQNMTSEFIDLLRPMTVLGRLAGFRRVPFNISIPRQTAGASVGWVGEGSAKPLSKGAFDRVTMKWAKAAGIVALTEELVRFSNPSAEALVRDDLLKVMATFLDDQFLDPSVAVVADVSPASITNGADTSAASGQTALDFINDAKTAFINFAINEIPLDGSYWIMRPAQAISLMTMLNALSQPYFPTITPNGGTLLGFPVITSNSVSSGDVVFLNPREILLADDGMVTLDSSREASLQMDDSPTDGATTTINLWQHNMVGIRAERWINWLRRYNEAVYVITSADYGGMGTGT